jgi:hypothetical protein
LRNSVTFYIDLTNLAVSSIRPDMTGKVEVSVKLPNGVQFLEAFAQLQALAQVAAAGSTGVIRLDAVLAVELGDPA